jgi:hypothetical protein
MSGELIVSTERFCYEGWLVRLDVSGRRAGVLLLREGRPKRNLIALGIESAGAEEWARARIKESKSQHRS